VRDGNAGCSFGSINKFDLHWLHKNSLFNKFWSSSSNGGSLKWK
jgi:hypothetical protein